MKINLLQKMMWIILPIVFLSIMIVNVSADNIVDSSDSVCAQVNITSVANDLPKGEMGPEEHTYTSSLILGMCASGISAIILLIVYYFVLRPRVEIMPIVAYEENTKKEDGKVQTYYIVLKNKSVFPICNIQIEISVGRVHLNEDHVSNVFDEQTCMYLAGRWHDENKKELQVSFNLPQRGLPRELTIAVIGRHALSGNTIPIEHTFKIDDFVEGHYEKGVFVKKGLDYTQALLRAQHKKDPYIVAVIVIGIVLAGILLFTIGGWSSIENILLIGLLTLLGAICFLLYQLHFISRVKAYSSIDPKHIFKAIVVKTSPKSHPVDLTGVEDVEAEEVRKKSK